MNETERWLIASASVKGNSHERGNQPNQDAFFIAHNDEETVVAVAVCDGAGSARYSKQGADHFAKHIANALRSIGTRIDRDELPVNHPHLLGDSIYSAIESARNELDPKGETLEEHHCTLVAFVASQKCRLVVKVGDSILTWSEAVTLSDGRVDYFANILATPQDRGEYVNETSFVTQAQWRKHVDWFLLPQERPDGFVVLMTDGAAEIATKAVGSNRNLHVYRPFFANLTFNLLVAKPEERDKLVENSLSDPRTFVLTGDDKTMVFLIGRAALENAGKEPMVSAPPAIEGEGEMPITAMIALRTDAFSPPQF